MKEHVNRLFRIESVRRMKANVKNEHNKISVSFFCDTYDHNKQKLVFSSTEIETMSIVMSDKDKAKVEKFLRKNYGPGSFGYDDARMKEIKKADKTIDLNR